jgi:hypothetical protein
MEMRTVADGSYSRAESRGAVAAFDETTYRSRWQSLISTDEQAPPVDFASESVVFVTAGQFPTGGYALKFHGAAMEGETLVIDAAVEGPPAGAIATQAITSPYVVIAVKSRAFKDVRWK